MKYGLIREVVLAAFLVFSIVGGVWLLLYGSTDYWVLGFVILGSVFVVTIVGFFLFKLHDKHRLARLKSQIALSEFNVAQFEKELTEYPDLRNYLEDNDFQVMDYIDNGLWGSLRYLLFVDNKRENFAVYKADSAFFSIPIKSVFLHCYRNATIGDYSQKTQEAYYEKKKMVEKATTVTNVVGAALALTTGYGFVSTAKENTIHYWLVAISLYPEKDGVKEIRIPLMYSPQKTLYIDDELPIACKGYSIDAFLNYYSKKSNPHSI